jgi:hypothetical protein
LEEDGPSRRAAGPRFWGRWDIVRSRKVLLCSDCRYESGIRGRLEGRIDSASKIRRKDGREEERVGRVA